jgi:hypothetical protein
VLWNVDRRIEWFAASGEGKRDSFDVELSNYTYNIRSTEIYVDKDQVPRLHISTLYSVYGNPVITGKKALKWRCVNKLNHNPCDILNIFTIASISGKDIPNVWI